MDGSDEIALVILIFIALVIFSVGIAIGNTSTTQNIREDLCKQLNTETISYFACKEKQLDEIIKEIK